MNGAILGVDAADSRPMVNIEIGVNVPNLQPGPHRFSEAGCYSGDGIPRADCLTGIAKGEISRASPCESNGTAHRREPPKRQREEEQPSTTMHCDITLCQRRIWRAAFVGVDGPAHRGNRRPVRQLRARLATTRAHRIPTSAPKYEPIPGPTQLVAPSTLLTLSSTASASTEHAVVPATTAGGTARLSRPGPNMKVMNGKRAKATARAG